MVIECDINLLDSLGISPTAYCWLIYQYKGLNYPFEHGINSTIIKYLEEKELIRVIGLEISLTEKAKDLFREREDTKNISSWIQEYCDLFPAGILNGATPVKSAKNNCLKKMITFVNQHKKITKADILEATTIYVERKKNEKYKFMTSSQNFISKDGDSLLLTFVEDGKAREEWRERIQNTNEGGSAFHKQL